MADALDLSMVERADRVTISEISGKSPDEGEVRGAENGDSKVGERDSGTGDLSDGCIVRVEEGGGSEDGSEKLVVLRKELKDKSGEEAVQEL